jgi:SAM-dependent methyltransferase
MNRKERRIAAKLSGTLNAPARACGESGAVSIADHLAAAHRLRQCGHLTEAHDVCRTILAREPAHVPSLNLLGVIAQGCGRQNAAVKAFAKAIAADEFNPACHYNIAASYQALGRREDAAAHFRTALARGMSETTIEGLILQNPAVVAWLARIAKDRPPPADALCAPAPSDLAAVAHDIFLRCALETVPLFGAALEVFLTRLRATLLRIAGESLAQSRIVEDEIAELFCALARQCFINEYIFAQSEEETRRAATLRDWLAEYLAAQRDIPLVLLAAVAAYRPLNSLPDAERLFDKAWPESATTLLRQQLREPLQEACDRSAIPALTAVEDRVSLQVMRQYEDNPYPRWTINWRAPGADGQDPYGRGQSGIEEILIAGCGTGRHALEAAMSFPTARVLAVDISRASLAYARRKTREQGLHNIDYAQADILKLTTVGRSFDRIECIGVLHHLADPWAGWRTLLALLKPDGAMRIGLYSDVARQAVVDARALIAERGYRPTAEDMRKLRQDILRENDDRLKILTAAVDFYNMSGCRDLLFNVVEQRVTIPQIKAFLDERQLNFLGFELAPRQIEGFQRRFPGAALTDLDCWHAFEAENPRTFLDMYVFSVRRRAPT